MGKICTKDGCGETAGYWVSFVTELMDRQPMCKDHAIHYLDIEKAVVKEANCHVR